MKVVILAGGFGTRISEESYLKPKPMIEIGEKPILWHIMKYFSHFGFNEFIICLGYKAHKVKEFFDDYYLYTSDIEYDFINGEKKVLSNTAEPWKVTLIDTGLHTMTGGRLKRVKDYIGDEPFIMTYGDGVADVDLLDLIDFHKKGNRLATITAVQPGGRFGVLDLAKDGQIKRFREKSVEDGGWINGGFMVLEPQVLDYIDGDKTTFEREPLETIASEGNLDAYKHYGFWQCMDTMKDKQQLEELFEKGEAPWKVWQD
ncbi:glucose-1-phosphate cytidylyltransferase [Dubosiella newyorkensis]|uniref:Glucose-1-phosphate cytidylyltransferase n=2 Tax=Dubosiella newyorkensis TaxID=1862672 RepID=A0A1U7NN68_9FIRM|nr:glucose-1-phosphate cytidylyltransferase [Dubosiella newyorkensis]OLU46745.1 glucose-1-phosphate cytidylyltransferase [Dubosiella newyorkensis]